MGNLLSTVPRIILNNEDPIQETCSDNTSEPDDTSNDSNNNECDVGSRHVTVRSISSDSTCSDMMPMTPGLVAMIEKKKNQGTAVITEDPGESEYPGM